MASVPAHTQSGTQSSSVSAPATISAMPAILETFGPFLPGRHLIGIPITFPVILCATPSGVPAHILTKY